MVRYDDYEIIEKFRKIGIGKIESQVYVNLLMSGPARIGVISKRLNLERNLTYRALVKLRNDGIVETTMSNPPSYVAIPPRKLVSVLLAKLNEDITAIKKNGKILTNLLKKRKADVDTDNSNKILSFNILQGKNTIYATISSLLKNSTNMVYVVMSSQDLIKVFHTSIPEAIQKCKNRNNDVRIITTNIPSSMIDLINEIKASEIRINTLPSHGYIILEVGKKVIISGNSVEDRSTYSYEESVIITDNINMVQNMYFVCNELWSSSEPLNLIINT